LVLRCSENFNYLRIEIDRLLQDLKPRQFGLGYDQREPRLITGREGELRNYAKNGRRVMSPWLLKLSVII